MTTKACSTTWTDQHPAVDHDEHACVFVTRIPHTRHECRCGLNTHERAL